MQRLWQRGIQKQWEMVIKRPEGRRRSDHGEWTRGVHGATKGLTKP